MQQHHLKLGYYPLKIYPDNTNLMHAAYVPLAEDQVKGKVRETFVVNQMQNLEKPIFYSPIGDFKIEHHLFEVGGKNKTHKQLKKEKDAFVLSDDVIVGSQGTIPLYLLGFLY